MMTYETELTLTCSGNYIPAKKMEYSFVLDQYLPGEPAHVENFRVFFGKKDVTSECDERLLKKLMAEYIDQESEQESA